MNTKLKGTPLTKTTKAKVEKTIAKETKSVHLNDLKDSLKLNNELSAQIALSNLNKFKRS